MTKKYLTVLSLSFFCAFAINSLSAQDSKTKTKVIVVEKKVDENGNVEMKKDVMEGKDGEKYIRKIEIETEDSDDMTVKKKRRIRIVKKDGNGNQEVIEWSGEGDIPENIEKMLEEGGGDIESIDVKKEKNVVIRMKDGDDEKEVIIKSDDYDIGDGNLMFFGDDVDVEFIKESEMRKAQLGVVIEETKNEKGVTIIEIIEGTAAEKAGLRKGDIITKIEDKEILNPEGLVNEIKDRESGEEIKINFSRNGEDLVMKVKLEAFNMWEEIEVDDIEEIIIIKKKKK